MTENTRDTIEARVPEDDLEARIARVGRQLAESLGEVLAAIPGASLGPQALAQALSVDKVLTSRILKAMRSKDPLAVAHHIPGPDPLRRFLRAARRRGAPPATVEAASAAVTEFESLIRREAGDRSSLAAIISTWLPEVRSEFELRSKQAAFRAMSQLKGAMTDTSLSTVILHPSSDDEHIDVVWLFGLLGLKRLRPGVGGVKFATRRMAPVDSPRRPVNLDGEPIHTVADARLDAFCESPAEIEVHQVGEVMHYTLAGHSYGPGSAVDLVIAEANFQEMPRFVPAELQRKGNVFAEVGTPSKRLIFDVFVHEDIYPTSDAQLLIYDTVLDGAADINDPVRDIDRMDFVESIQMLGRGTERARDAKVPNYVELLRHTFSTLGWNDRQFRIYRVAIDYPVYGSQVAMAFDPPPPPESSGDSRSVG